MAVVLHRPALLGDATGASIAEIGEVTLKPRD